MDSRKVNEALRTAELVVGLVSVGWLMWVMFPGLRVGVAARVGGAVREYRAWWKERHAPEQMRYEIAEVLTIMNRGGDLDRSLPASTRQEPLCAG